MNKSLWIISAIVLPLAGNCQEHGNFEQYYYTGAGTSVVVPRVYYQSRNNWIGEIRYNYEELQTVSFNAGKMFSNNKALSYTITPYAGMVLGKLSGGTIGSNATIDYGNLYFSSESQYTFSVRNRTENFFFNWTELGYQFTGLLYAGIALQLTHPYEIKNNWEPGVSMGFTYKSWTFPLYAFNPTNDNRNYVMGVNWEWSYEKQKKSKDFNLIY